MLGREGTARPERRRVLLDRELDWDNVDIAAISIIHLADVGDELESTYTFFWSGTPATENRGVGVGFALRFEFVSSKKSLRLSIAAL